jgi:hypothetical protein
VRLAEHHNMVEAATVSAPRLGDRGCPSHERGRVRETKSAVAVTNQMTRRFIPGESFSYLARDPRHRRIAGNSDPGDYVFKNTMSEPIDQTSFYKLFCAAQRVLGIRLRDLYAKSEKAFIDKKMVEQKGFEPVRKARKPK